MAVEETRAVARLEGDDLDRLERRLSIAKSKLEPGAVVFRGEPFGETGEVQAPERQEELDDIAHDIVTTARAGVEIASQAESRPLIALFEAAGTDLPPEVRVDHEQMKYDFYSVEAKFSVLLPTDQFPLSAQFALELDDDVDEPARRLRPIRLFPGYKDVEYFSANLQGAVGLDAGLNFWVPVTAANLVPFAKVSGDASLKAGLVLGPLPFQFRRTAIEVKGESDQRILWRYNMKSELTGTNMFSSVLVLKIAEEAGSARMEARLTVVPCKRRWLVFKEQLPALSDTVRLPIELVGG